MLILYTLRLFIAIVWCVYMHSLHYYVLTVYVKLTLTWVYNYLWQ